MSRSGTVTAHVVRVLLGLIVVVFGLSGFVRLIVPFEHPNGGGRFGDLPVASGYLYAVMALAVLAGALLLVNRYVILSLRLLGPFVVSILLLHLFLEPRTLIASLMPAALWAWLVWIYRHDFDP